MTHRMIFAGGVIVMFVCGLSDAVAQSSSLYVAESRQRNERVDVAQPMGETVAEPRNNTGWGGRRAPHYISPDIAASSFAAVKVPEPRRFAKHDLITIIIRESTETDFEATMETEKEVGVDGEISQFPRFNLRDLLNAQLRPNDMEEGVPAVGVDFGNEFTGEGGYSRSESITGRITAKVIDVKPNGMLVLEARKHLRTDEESLDLVITGSCRPEDVTIDNSVLSTQLYNLRLDKQHEGELRNSTKKGLLTKVMDLLFNF